MAQQYEFIKVAAGEPFPFETKAYHYSFDESLIGGIFTSRLYKDEVRGDDLYIMRPSSPPPAEVEGLINTIEGCLIEAPVDFVGTGSWKIAEPEEKAWREEWQAAIKALRQHFPSPPDMPGGVTESPESYTDDMVARFGDNDMMEVYCFNEESEMGFKINNSKIAGLQLEDVENLIWFLTSHYYYHTGQHYAVAVVSTLAGKQPQPVKEGRTIEDIAIALARWGMVNPSDAFVHNIMDLSKSLKIIGMAEEAKEMDILAYSYTNSIAPQPVNGPVWVKASEKVPDTRFIELFFKWKGKRYAGSFSDMAFWADGICLNQRFYDEVEYLDESPAPGK